MIWALVAALGLALFASAVPSMGVLGALAVVAGCSLVASGAAIPFFALRHTEGP